jgi:hypothetical protein
MAATEEYPVDLRTVLQHQSDVLTRAQALRHVTKKELRRLLVSGLWRTCHRGVYVARVGRLDTAQRRWIAVLAARGHLAGSSALELLGLQGHPDRMTHVLVPARLQDTDPPRSVAVHRTSVLSDDDRTSVDGLPCTTPGRSLVDAVQWAVDDDRAWAVAAACVRQGLVAASAVRAALDRMPRAHRRALIIELLGDLSGSAHPLPETEFLRLCRRAGFPRPKLQVSRRDANGRLRYLDGYFEEYCLHVEIDGGQHPDPATWWGEVRRHNELWIPGERVLHLPAWAVRKRPDEVVAQVRTALVAAGWAPRWPGS